MGIFLEIKFLTKGKSKNEIETSYVREVVSILFTLSAFLRTYHSTIQKAQRFKYTFAYTYSFYERISSSNGRKGLHFRF